MQKTKIKNTKLMRLSQQKVDLGLSRAADEQPKLVRDLQHTLMSATPGLNEAAAIQLALGQAKQLQV